MANSQYGLDEDYVLIGDEEENAPAPKKSKTPIFLVIIIILLLIIAGLSAWIISSLNEKNAFDPTTSTTGDVSGTTSVTSVPQDDPNGEESINQGDVISGDINSTASGTTSTTDTPSFEPETNYVGKKTTFEGTTDTKLKLVVDCGKVMVNGEEKVKIQAFISCAALYCSPRKVEINVNGDTKTYTSPRYEFTGQKSILIPYAERIVDVSSNGNYDITVSVPNFNVTYSETLIESLTAHANVKF